MLWQTLAVYGFGAFALARLDFEFDLLLDVPLLIRTAGFAGDLGLALADRLIGFGVAEFHVVWIDRASAGAAALAETTAGDAVGISLAITGALD